MLSLRIAGEEFKVGSAWFFSLGTDGRRFLIEI